MSHINIDRGQAGSVEKLNHWSRIVMADVTIEINPRKAFRPYLFRHEQGIRWAGMMVHRRGGKTVCAAQDMGAQSLTHERKNMTMAPLRYAYIAPTQQQAEDIVWGYFSQFFTKIPGAKLNQQKLRVTMPRSAGNGSFVARYPF